MVGTLVRILCFSTLAVASSQGLAAEWARSFECKPLEVHLGVTESPTTMRVTWRTRSADCPSFALYAAADYNDASARKAYGISYKGDSKMLCEEPASTYAFVLHLHTVVMAGLEPNGDYTYRLPYDARTFRFTASKPRGDASPYVFFIFGDMGIKSASAARYAGAEVVQSAMLEEMKHGVPDLMLDVGDISYADGNPSIWEDFMKAIEPFASQTLWVAGVGNHEYDLGENPSLDPWGLEPFQPSWGNLNEGDSRGECGLHVYWRFPVGQGYIPLEANKQEGIFLPLPPHGEPFAPFYYSFDQGLVHFIMLSTEHDVGEESAQVAWLKTDLASVDRCLTPYVVAMGHRPFYTPEYKKGDYATGRGLGQALEPILIQYRVDLYVSGHVHNYYRLCEANNGTCVAPGEGLVSMVIGSGGHSIEQSGHEDFDLEELVLLKTWGFGKFVVHGYESLDFLFIEAETGTVLDEHRFLNQGNCLKRSYVI